MTTKFHDAINTYEGRHRRTVERAYDAPWPGHRFYFYVGKHRMTDIRCDWCDGRVIEPVRGGEEVSWRRDQARVWCGTDCQRLRYDAEIDAAAS